MRTFSPGDAVTFKSEHGTLLSGTVYDSNDVAIMITTNFGVYSVDPSKIISGGTWKITVNTSNIPKKELDDSYDIGWWDSTFVDEDGDVY